jgi:uncharacterized SAM-binding protein YcdF (DUF218 family)
MFFIFSKLLHFLISPLTWIMILLLISLVKKNPVHKKRFLVAILFLLLFFSNSFILDEFMRLWEVPAVSNSKIPVYENGIVLGGVSFYDGQLKRIQFARSGDRLFQALELYHKGIIKKIIFTGGSGSILHSDEKEAPFIREFLLRIGFPDSSLIIETESKNTHENALFIKPLLKNRKETSLLITSAVHMRRSLGCFKKEGIEVMPYSTDRYSGPRKFEFDHLLIPNVDALFTWNILMHEYAGYLVYKIAGYS